MKRKLIRKKFESILRKRQIPYSLLEERKKRVTQIQLSFPCLPEGIEAPSLTLYRHYLILDLLGWKVIERYGDEDHKKFQIMEIMEAFLEKNLKIKIFFSGGRPKFWKIFLFQESFWKLYATYRFPWIFFKRKKKSFKEWNIEDLIRKHQGE